MPKFSPRSLNKLHTCHPLLQEWARAVVRKVDCTVVCGHRSRRDQNQAFKDGNSEKKWPDSDHNVMPSNAIDLAPHIAGKGIIKDPAQCAFFARQALKIAEAMGIDIGWCGDWDGDGDLTDQKLRDFWHFWLKSKKEA